MCTGNTTRHLYSWVRQAKTQLRRMLLAGAVTFVPAAAANAQLPYPPSPYPPGPDPYNNLAGPYDPLQQELQRQSQALQNQQQALNNQTLALTNSRASLDNVTVGLQNDRVARELLEFRRMQNLVVADLTAARVRRSYFETQRQQLIRYLNGQSTPATLTSFRKSLIQVEQTAEMKNLLGMAVPPISGSDFERKVELFGIIRSDGALKPAPLVTGDTGVRYVHPAAFERSWSNVIALLRSTGQLSARDLNELRYRLSHWSHAVDRLSDQWSENDRIRLNCYRRALENLVAELQRPRIVELLREHVDPEVRSFAGGSVADLVQHLVERRVSVKYGSPAQLLVSDLGRDMYRNLDQQIARLEERIENLKSQSAGFGTGAMLVASGGDPANSMSPTRIEPSMSTGFTGASPGGASEPPPVNAVSATGTSNQR